MAIAFCRLKYVTRTKNQNACAKSAYVSRSKVCFNGTKFQEPKIYNWSRLPAPEFRTVLLPDHVDKKFQNAELLWNLAEQKEGRKNSQVQIELVAALPDDSVIGKEDREELIRSFVLKNFVSEGLAAEIAIHQPEDHFSEELIDEEEERKAPNWHAHVLLATRRFKENGQELEDHKARDLMVQVAKGKVVSKEKNWGKIWAQHQNEYFEEKGISLRVDPTGAVPQKHLGPLRMRGRPVSLVVENAYRRDLNTTLLKEPKTLLDHITKHHSVFDYDTVELYVQKIDGLGRKEMGEMVEKFWSQKEILPLFAGKNGRFTEKYTTKDIVDEEKEILRNATRLKRDSLHRFKYRKKMDAYVKELSHEQKGAFKETVEGDGLVCINGLAGTGKSTLLDALKNFYLDRGYVTRGLGPDTATAKALQERGFIGPKNIHRFLFSYVHGKEEVQHAKEIWFVDESSKIGNSSLRELLKIAVLKNVKVVFSGDVSQLSPIERGNCFLRFCEKFGFVALEDVQRQQKEEDREIVRLLSRRNLNKEDLTSAQKAIDAIESSGGFHWEGSKIDSIKSLMRAWARTKTLDSGSSTLVFALKKQEVDILNDIIRLYRKGCGEIGKKDYLCRSEQGTFVLSEGDAIVFKRRSSEIGIENGDRGVVKSITPTLLTVDVEGNNSTKTVQFSPEKYSHFHLGYAVTNFGSQGSTVDHSFVLMSPQVRLSASYVFFSRHRKSVQGFIAKDEIANLATLKKLVTKDIPAPTTIGLVTKEEWEKKEKLDLYLKSDSVFKRAYGKAWHSVSEWDIWTRRKDARADQKFFQPRIAPDEGVRIRVISKDGDYPMRSITNNAFVQTEEEVRLSSVDQRYLRKEFRSDETSIQLSSRDDIERGSLLEIEEGRLVIDRDLGSGDVFHVSEFVKELQREVEIFEHFPTKTRDFDGISFQKAEVLSSYHQLLKKCEKLKEKDQFFASDEWKKAVIERNKAAYSLAQLLSKQEVALVFEESSLRDFKSYSQKHAGFLQKGRGKNVVIEDSHGDTLSDVRQQFIRETRKSYEVEQEGGTNKLTGSKQKLVDDYRSKSSRASGLFKVGQEKANEKGVAFEHTAIGKEFFSVAHSRNESAHVLLKSCEKEELASVFSAKEIKTLRFQAEKYVDRREHQEKNTPKQIANELTSRMEELCSDLFPEGFSDRRGHSLRFGTNGSLSVNISGSHAGSFKSFETEESGGPIRLIQYAKGLSFREALKYARDFLGRSVPVTVPNAKRSRAVERESNWVSVQPPKGAIPPELSNVNPSLAKSFDEVGRYFYRDEKGELLFCVLRIEPKEGGSKQMRPLSFGFNKGIPDQMRWSTVGYQSEFKSIYGLERLYANPQSTVLVVEGEKTADAASKLLERLGKEDCVVVSWIGGTGSVDKVDWNHLRGREVIIWPDNDDAGIKAGKNICSHLRRVGISSLRMVREGDLQRFPEKWDLADSLPGEMKGRDILDMLLSSHEKGIDPSQVLVGISSSLGVDHNDPVQKARVNDILWRVDERMRPELEEKYGNRTWDVHNEIISEATRILSRKGTIQQELKEQVSDDGSLLKRLTHQVMIFEAEFGKAPSKEYLGSQKERVRGIGWLASVERIIVDDLSGRENSHEIKELVLDKLVEKYALPVRGLNQSEAIKYGKNLMKDLVSAFQKDVDREKQKEMTLEMER